jgi:molybdenum cofactor cytidylyltransferase
VAEPIELNQFANELGLGAKESIALVGGGGKTTLLHALGRQLGGRVLLTTTTKMGSDQHGGFPIILASDGDVQLPATGTSMVWQRIEGTKVFGVSVEKCDMWAQLANYLVIEADGSRQHPFKAPATYEPVVPRSVTLMISVIGADALGRVIGDQCHRPLRVAALAGCQPYQRLSPSGAATVLLHQRGARRECPAGARFVVAITKVDEPNDKLVDHLVTELHSMDSELDVIRIRNFHR